ncbi:hypothetical protein RYX36_004494 [Vicia faba]
MGDNHYAQNFTIGDEDGSSSSSGVVQNITSTEKTNDIIGKIESSKEVNPNEYEIIEEKKVMIDCRKFIGCDIYKEFEGVKSLGTVITYMTSLKLFEVMYQNDSRLEYLNYNEVFSHLAEKDKIYEVQLTKPKRNPLEVRIEFERKRELARKLATNEKKITSKRKMEDSLRIGGKSSSKKEKTSDSHSSSNDINIKQTEVISQPKESAKSKKNENLKSTRKSTKKELKTKRRPWHAKRENATKEEPYEPYQFRGFYICKELNGIRSLGTVIGYCPEKNKLIIQYQSDDRMEYMTQLETLRSMAKHADIMPSPSLRSKSVKGNVQQWSLEPQKVFYDICKTIVFLYLTLVYVSFVYFGYS